MRLLSTVFCLVSLFSATAFSQETFRDVPGSTVYQKINALYETGTLFDPSVLHGKVGSGRCFKASAQDNPYASYIIAQTTLIDVGPIESPRAIYHGILQYAEGVPPAYFDADSVTINDPKIASAAMLEYRRLDRQTWVINYGSGESTLIRQTPSYIIGIIKDNTGRQSLACYYFKIH